MDHIYRCCFGGNERTGDRLDQRHGLSLPCGRRECFRNWSVFGRIRHIHAAGTRICAHFCCGSIGKRPSESYVGDAYLARRLSDQRLRRAIQQ